MIIIIYIYPLWFTDQYWFSVYTKFYKVYITCSWKSGSIQILKGEILRLSKVVYVVHVRCLSDVKHKAAKICQGLSIFQQPSPLGICMSLPRQTSLVKLIKLVISVYPNDVNHSDHIVSRATFEYRHLVPPPRGFGRGVSVVVTARLGKRHWVQLCSRPWSKLVKIDQNRRVENSDRLADLAASECHMSHSAAGGRWWRMMDVDGDKKDDITYVESKYSKASKCQKWHLQRISL